jgi:microcystin-dependent protein
MWYESLVYQLLTIQRRKKESIMGVAAPIAIGSIIAFAGPGPGEAEWEEKSGFLLCDGRSQDRKADGGKIQPLFDAIGSSWGGDGVNKFNVPDLEGRFLRGVSGSSGRDPEATDRLAAKPGGHIGNQVGSVQEDTLQKHKHNDPGHTHPVSSSGTVTVPSSFREDCDSGDSAKVNGNEGDQGSATFNLSINTVMDKAQIDMGDPVASTAGAARSSLETRVKNAAVLWVIRWR